MKRISIVFICILIVLSLSACSNSEVDSYRMKVDLENKKIESVVSEYHINIEAYNKLNPNFEKYLFSSTNDLSYLSDFSEYFVNKDIIENDLDTVYQKISKTAHKNDVSVDSIKNGFRSYCFLDGDTGCIDTLYIIPIVNTIMFVDFIIQGGQYQSMTISYAE